MNWSLILDYLRVFIWPALVVELAFAFRGQIRSWLGRPPSAFELPGGLGRLEWSNQQQAQLEAHEADPDEALAPFEEDDFVEALRDTVRQEVEQEAEQDRRELCPRAGQPPDCGRLRAADERRFLYSVVAEKLSHGGAGAVP